VLEQIVQFIERAVDETWSLDIAIYEYELNQPSCRGSPCGAMFAVYHAKAGDDQTVENEYSLEGLPSEVKQSTIINKHLPPKFIEQEQVREHAVPRQYFVEPQTSRTTVLTDRQTLSM